MRELGKRKVFDLFSVVLYKYMRNNLDAPASFSVVGRGGANHHGNDWRRGRAPEAMWSLGNGGLVG